MLSPYLEDPFEKIIKEKLNQKSQDELSKVTKILMIYLSF